jgi:hypothetical protein
VSNTAFALLVVLAFAAGVALGWHGRGWHDGSTVSAATADLATQSAVQAGAGAAVSIDRAQGVTERAEERVRIVTRTVTVDGGCTPGAGAVSDALADELREAVR